MGGGGSGGCWVGLAALTTLSVRLFVCLLTSTSIQRLIGHSLKGGRKGGGQPGGGSAGGSQASREGLQTTDKLYTLP